MRRLDNLLDCMNASKVNLIGFAKGFDRLGRCDGSLEDEAVSLAKAADVVVLCLGLDEIQESEGLDRTNMRLQKIRQSY